MNDDLMQNIYENIMMVKSDTANISGQIYDIRERLNSCYENSEKLDNRLRKVENLMIPIGAILMGVMCYIVGIII